MVETHSGTMTQINTQYYDHLMPGMTEGLVFLNQAGFVMSANEVAARLLGYEITDLVGRHYQVFWSDPLLPLEQVDNRLPSEPRQLLETVLFRSDGREVPVSLSITPMIGKTESGRMISITGLVDVQRLQDAISHAQRLAGVGILTASVAHELNTPISIITATCGNLLHEIDDENRVSLDSLRHYIQMIEQNAWRSARIVGVLKNYTFDNDPNMAVTDWNMIVEDALTLVHQQFKNDANIQVVTDLQSDLKSVVCDHNRMTQVLVNLLINARDAMQPGGGVIQIISGIRPKMNRENSSGDEEFIFAVKDQGCGISPQIMDKIFDPFFTTKPEGKGTGLGLFIARRIVEQHNGRIQAANNPDGGATFTITLPRRQ